MAEDTKKTPAYVSYKTFKSSIMGLDHVANTIDYSVYKSMNGSTRNFLFGAFRFFDLINATGAPSKRFRDMATKDESVWNKNMGDLVRSHYQPQLEALASGTTASLKTAFGDIGQSVVAPACRFLIAAAKDAGIPVSPSIESGSIGNATPRKKRTKGASTEKHEDNLDDGGGSNEHAGTLSFPVPIQGKDAGRIVVPKDMSEEDLPMFQAMVAAVVAYAKQGKSK